MSPVLIVTDRWTEVRRRTAGDRKVIPAFRQVELKCLRCPKREAISTLFWSPGEWKGRSRERGESETE